MGEWGGSRETRGGAGERAVRVAELCAGGGGIRAKVPCAVATVVPSCSCFLSAVSGWSLGWMVLVLKLAGVEVRCWSLVWLFAGLSPNLLCGT